MRLRLRSTAILGLALLASVGAGYAGYDRFSTKAESSALPPHSEVVTVQRGPLVVTVSTSGSVAAGQQAKLTFDTSGRLQSLLVKVGDTVSQGQILAQLDSTTLARKLSEAQSTLRTSQIKLQQLQTGPAASDIAAAQSNYDAAVSKLQQLQAPPASDALAAAQQNYDSAVNKYKILMAGPTPDDLATVQAALDKATAALQQAQAAYDKVSWRSDIASRPEAVTLEQATADYQSALAAYNKAAAGPTADQVNSANAAILTAKNQVDQLTTGATPDQLSAAQASVASAKAALDAKLTGPAATDIALAQEAIVQAQLAADQAQEDLDAANLRAPFNGTVASVTANVGEMQSTNSVIVTLVDPTTVRVDTTVDESDIAKIQVGQPVTMTVDALLNARIAGQVTAISTIGNVQQGVVTYLVSIGLSRPNDGSLKTGMTASASIVVQSKSNVLFVPNRAVRLVGRNHVVDVLVNGKVERQTVQIGMSNDTSTEITSGLQDGQEVVISGTTTTAPRVNTGSIPGLGTGGAGGAGGALGRGPGG